MAGYIHSSHDPLIEAFVKEKKIPGLAKELVYHLVMMLYDDANNDAPLLTEHLCNIALDETRKWQSSAREIARGFH